MVSITIGAIVGGSLNKQVMQYHTCWHTGLLFYIWAPPRTPNRVSELLLVSTSKGRSVILSLYSISNHCLSCSSISQLLLWISTQLLNRICYTIWSVGDGIGTWLPSIKESSTPSDTSNFYNLHFLRRHLSTEANIWFKAGWPWRQLKKVVLDENEIRKFHGI